jgi:hypothetical protein
VQAKPPAHHRISLCPHLLGVFVRRVGSPHLDVMRIRSRLVRSPFLSHFGSS